MSSGSPVISARGLGKSYVIQERNEESTAAETVLQSFSKRLRKTSAKTFWPLRDVSFDVNEGDIVGIIGHNGAGKSTLLKVLSRIVSPSEGEAKIRGRMGSLIDVGTGFQPELTGRENIYLNGAILGMQRREITSRFDEIVDFSGVEKFLDTPVKRYSSGMYTRLAFAVAAHLDAEILLVDEVLSVGDAEFQKKSLGKMSSVANSGRTILFVSHNLASMENLCNRGLLLHRGQLLHSGPLGETLEAYNKASHNNVSEDGRSLTEYIDYKGQYEHFVGSDLRDENGQSVRAVSVGDDLYFHFRVKSDHVIESPILVVYIDNGFGQNVITLKSPQINPPLGALYGEAEVVCQLPKIQLNPGNYNVNVWIYNGGGFLEDIRSSIYFTVSNSDIYGDGWGAHETGAYVAPSQWRMEAVRS